MIQALVNGIWKSFDEKDLQPGTNSFTMDSGLYETFRTKNFKPVLLQPHLDRLFQSAEKINLPVSLLIEKESESLPPMMDQLTFSSALKV